MKFSAVITHSDLKGTEQTLHTTSALVWDFSDHHKRSLL